MAGVTPVLWLKWRTAQAIMEAAWWARGPEALSGTHDDAGSVHGVARITAVLQHGAYRERTSVCLGHIYLSMLNGERPHTTLTEHTADLHRTVPFSLLAGEVFVIALQRVAFVTEILQHCAMSQTMAWGWVAGVTPVLWLHWGGTVAIVEAAWWARGPEALSGADDDAGYVHGVARITAVLQHCAHRERASVRLGHIYSAMLDRERPHAT